MDPQHWFKVVSVENDSKPSPIRALFLKMVNSTDYKIAGLYSVLDPIYTMTFVQVVSLHGEGWGTKPHHGNIPEAGHLHSLQN
ncbi:MAG: hypothetical protein ACK56I_32945, partial [bacterium]